MEEGSATKLDSPALRVERATGAAAGSPPVRRPMLGTFAAGVKGLVRVRPGARSSVSAAWQSERDHGIGLLFVPVFMGCGSWAWFELDREPSLLALMAVVLVSGGGAWVWRHRRDLPGYTTRAVFLFVLGMVLAAFESHRLSTLMLDRPVTTTIDGRVLSREADDRGRIRYRIEVRSTLDPALRRPPETVNLLARGDHAPIAIGEGITGRARLNPPSGPALPGLNDFAFDAYVAGTGAIGFFYGAPTRRELDDAGAGQAWPAVVARIIAGWRAALTEHIRARIGGDAGAIAAALITGEQRGISPGTMEALRQAGLAHILAISGLNMVLAAGTLLVGARLLLSIVPGVAERFPVKKIAAVGGLITVTLYILISGGAVSAIRSWLMIVVMLIAVLFDRAAISRRNIALSAIVILAVTPSTVTGPGFQMSYAATLGLVAGYAIWRDRPVSRRPAAIGGRRLFGAFSSFLGGLLLSSLIGGVATLVYSIGHFHRIPAYGLAGNLLAMPIISILVMPMAVIAMLLMPLGLDGLPLAVMGRAISWMIEMATWVSGWGGEVTTGRLPPIAFAFIAVGGGLACLFRTRLALIALLPIVGGAALSYLAQPATSPQLLISEDGRFVAMLADGQAASNRTRPPDFLYDQWRRALRVDVHRPPVFLEANDDRRVRKAPAAETSESQSDTPQRRIQLSRTGEPRPPTGAPAASLAFTAQEPGELQAALSASAGEKRFVCRRKQWCAAVTSAGWRVVTLDDPAYLGIACDSADFVVAPQFINRNSCRSGARLITAATLRRTGALEIAPGKADGPPDGTGYRITKAVDTLDRPWARHRLYDWRTDSFADPQFPEIIDNAE
ncbi:ComEC/Rec2 family competence protein [Mycoplana dimorpha]|uniref:ComEC/Rec2-related protein n=2 Tax=Mycoplana dimorpha TaxID=28320 RepID=A0A2T5B7X1_MYCDI|nr:ComEC/Rec2 family competence protein [Mycoplana dimorpha]PTM95082.1 ComEC/Rec2-related protein [Mycoplana dimorpha]